ncbi:hypothetical protein [Pleionea sp. CnH1-48]|uniref:hypothetical protein n=1 Tax=Pleionea sp. CnH1-48 TaxID=2954494 RepID=UPI002096F667|nr:hypothetical protein [Pleionea sp. CnH1-48]MCO7224724.1 hypothetical protein [Pleionea sp. CnH1-48]
MNKNELIDSLKKMSDYELVQVMSEVLPLREPFNTELLVKTDRLPFLDPPCSEDGLIKIRCYLGTL